MFFLQKKVDEMTKQLATVSRRRMDLMHRKNAIENLLTKKLYKTKESLTAVRDTRVFWSKKFRIFLKIFKISEAFF